MHRIAVIGIGNLGFRHLESLHKSGMAGDLYAVDPASPARERAAGLGRPAGGGGLHVAASTAELPTALDVAVIATNSDVRLAMVEELLSRCAVRHLVLEKVLFQRPSDYARCSELLQAKEVNAFVNCPRRLYDVYTMLKDHLADGALQLLSVSGGEWGLGCNSIHYVDLFQFLGGATPEQYQLHLDAEIRPSKRRGFVEFTGTIAAASGAGRLVLTAVRGSQAKSLLVMVAGDRSCIVDEVAGLARLYERDSLLHELPFRVPYQSELTARVAEDLVSRGTCGLPTYADAAASHLPLVQALLAHVRKHMNPDLQAVPIT